MTTNCAYRLATLLREFRVPPGKTPESIRGFNGIGDLDSWRRHSDAADLVKTVDYTLQGMDAAGMNIEPFRDALPRWYAGVHFAATPWSSAQPKNSRDRPACSDADLSLLEALGLTFSTMKPITLTEDDRRTLVDVLAEARKLLEEDGSIPDDIKHYLWSLIIRAEMVVNNLDQYGTETVRQIALELGGAMTVQAGHAQGNGDSESANRWGATAWNLMVTCLVGVVSGAGGNIAAAPVIAQITGGS